MLEKGLQVGNACGSADIIPLDTIGQWSAVDDSAAIVAHTAIVNEKQYGLHRQSMQFANRGPNPHASVGTP